MTNQQLQHDLQPFGADQLDWADIEKLLGQYEKFVKDQKTDRAYRAGTTAFFLLFNSVLFLTFAVMAVRHAGENPLPTELPYLSFVGVAICFVWWQVVKGSYISWDGHNGPETHARRQLQRQAISMRWYWLLDRIPLQDETPPKGVATALPLAFIAIHIFLGAILAAIVA